MTEIRAYVLCKVTSGTEREVCKALAEYSDVLEVNIMYGEYDILTVIQFKNLEQLDFITDKIRMIPSVTFTSTMIIGKNYKENGKAVK